MSLRWGAEVPEPVAEVLGRLGRRVDSVLEVTSRAGLVRRRVEFREPGSSSPSLVVVHPAGDEWLTYAFYGPDEDAHGELEAGLESSFEDEGGLDVEERVVTNADYAALVALGERVGEERLASAIRGRDVEGSRTDLDVVVVTLTAESVLELDEPVRVEALATVRGLLVDLADGVPGEWAWRRVVAPTDP